MEHTSAGALDEFLFYHWVLHYVYISHFSTFSNWSALICCLSIGVEALDVEAETNSFNALIPTPVLPVLHSAGPVALK